MISSLADCINVQVFLISILCMYTPPHVLTLVAETGQLLMFLHFLQSSFINSSLLKAHPSYVLIAVHTSGYDRCFLIPGI